MSVYEGGRSVSEHKVDIVTVLHDGDDEDSAISQLIFQT